MERSKFSIIIYFIIGLAVIGLISALIRNPGSLITSILIAIGVAVVLYFVLTTILNRRSHGGTSDEMRKYRKAAKQSNQKYNNKQKLARMNQQTRPSTPVKVRKRRRKVPHLTVIEGKKGNNDKDRASN